MHRSNLHLTFKFDLSTSNHENLNGTNSFFFFKMIVFYIRFLVDFLIQIFIEK
jgi:hypothetical protein